MSNLRQAAQQALVAMGINQYTVAELAPHKVVMQFNDAISALTAALENEFNPDWDQVEALRESLREHMAEIQRLRAALAEDALQRLTDVQQEMEAHDPVDYRGWVLREVLFYNGEPVSHREPEQEPAVNCPRCGHCCPQQQAEPVAVYQWRKQGCADWYDGHPDYCDGGGPYETRMLYTAPPQRLALTDNAIWQIATHCTIGGDLHADKFARAIEAAHGIGEKHE